MSSALKRNRVHYVEHTFLCFISFFTTMIKMFINVKGKPSIKQEGECLRENDLVFEIQPLFEMSRRIKRLKNESRMLGKR